MSPKRLPKPSVKTLTKADIVLSVRDQTGLSWGEASALVEGLLEVMKSTLQAGDSLKISAFGSFLVRTKRARRGRNPQTSEQITITPRRVLTFKPSLVFRQALNRARGLQ
jgi:integration host factor subunit alpha